MTTVAELTIEMAANVARLSADMDAVRRKVSGTFSGIDRDVARFKSLMGGLFAGIGAVQVVQMADAVTQLRNRLNLATNSTTEAHRAFAALYDIAQRSRVSFTDLGGTYSAISRATQGMNLSQSQLLVVTEAIGNAMAIGGGSAESMNAALLQLQQGLASGTLRGEELNSVIEQTPRLAKALADGLGVSIGQLREMGKAGELSAQKVLQALGSQSAVLAKEVSGATLTVSGAMTQLTNASTKFVGDADKATGASTTLAGAMQDLAKGIGAAGTAISEHKGELTLFFGALAGAGLAGALPRIVTGLVSVAGAVKALGLALAANPVVLALLGIGAAVGAASAASSAFSKTADGLRQQIGQLEALNKRAASEPWDAVLNANVAERNRQIAALRVQLDAVGKSARDTFAMTDPRRVVGTDQGFDLGAGNVTDDKPTPAQQARQRAEARKAEAEALRKVIDLAEHRNRLFDEEFDRQEAQRMTVEGRIRDAREMLEAIEQETRLMGLAGLEREKAVALLELERKGVVKGTEAYERLAPAILKAIEARSARASGLMTSDEVIEEAARMARTIGKKTNTTLRDSIVDGILSGARSGVSLMDIFWREVKAQAARTILQPMIQPVADGLNGLISTGLNSLLSAFGGGVTSSGYNPGASMGFSSTSWEEFVPSFAGGGHTGNGSRSGGLDGQGGFMAMLHPRERVIDETAGGTAVNLKVEVISNAGAQVEQSTRTEADGTQVLSLLIKQAKASIADDLGNRSGEVSRALESGWGLRPAMS